MHLKCIMVLSFYHKGNHGNGSMTNEMKMKPHINNRILHYYLSSWGCTFIHFFFIFKYFGLFSFQHHYIIHLLYCNKNVLATMICIRFGLYFSTTMFNVLVIHYTFPLRMSNNICIIPITKVNYSSRE